MKGKGPEDKWSTSAFRIIMEKYTEYNLPLHMCFNDYAKAFDCVNHQLLWQDMQNMGFPVHVIELLEHLYKNQEAAVKTSYGTSEWFSIEREVSPLLTFPLAFPSCRVAGCIVSPSLFNIYSENIMRDATENTSAGITIGGRKINNLRYADDTTLLCESKEDLMEHLTRIQHLSKEKGLLLNTRKTKIMVVDKNRTDDHKFILNGEELEEVMSFVYLGSLINTEVGCMPDVNRRLCMTRSTIENMTTIWKIQSICKSIKLRIARPTAFAVATYGCAAWAYSKKVNRSI